MTRRTGKKRTHMGSQQHVASTPASRTPKSMVIRIGAGAVGKSVSQLVKDVREILEPQTAIKLQERKSNRLKDFTTMAGPLGVTHLLLFSRSSADNTTMRLALTPRGPTLSFRVEKYSLCKDVLKSQRHPKSSPSIYAYSPLLIMNNFKTIPDDAKDTALQSQRRTENFVADVFRSLFPPVSPESTKLGSVKRILLLNRETPGEGDNGTFTITLRHYSVSTKRVGVPKAIRRLNAAEKSHNKERRGKGMPNLGKLDDVADYMLDEEIGNYTSASDSEPETDGEVEVLAPRSKKLHYRAKLEKLRAANGGSLKTYDTDDQVERRGIVLSELGPRISLRLIKIEEGMCDGKVMWHDFITKSKEEERQMDAVWDKRHKEREERRRIQKENIERKRKEREAKRPEGEAKDEAEAEEYDAEIDDYEDWEDYIDEADIMDEVDLT